MSLDDRPLGIVDRDTLPHCDTKVNGLRLDSGKLGALVFIILAMVVCASADSADFIKGVDLSILPAVEWGGVQYKWNGQVTDPLLIFKDNGCNFVRLRLFVNPPGTQGQVNTLAYTLAMARRAKHAGLSILLDLHYSDGWADGHGQTIPSAWKGLTQTQLCDRVRTYTFQTLKTFDRAGCMPNMVALGNEITNGILWPAGGPMTTDKKWPALLQLLSSASAGVRQASPRGRTQIMIHLNCGGNFTISDWFFDHCRSAHLDYDVMGLSYYPFWSGDLGHLRSNLTNLSLKYGRQIVVAETGYPFRGKQGSLPFPATPSGQKAYLEKLMQIVSQTPGGRGRGVFYWEPAWIESSKWNGPKWSTQWEDRALFDEQGNALPAIAALRFEPIRPSGSLAGLER